MFNYVRLYELLKGSLTLASNSLSLFLNKRDRRSPLYVFWLLTYRCNCRCRHCNWVFENTSPEKLSMELSHCELLEVAHQLAKSKIWGVTISGGEPLMIKNIFEILEILKQSGKRVNICTNGVLLEDALDMLLKIQPDSVTISLDSHKPEIHDSIRGKRGVFQKIVSGIELLREKRKKKKPSIILKMTISKNNIDSIDEFISTFNKRCDYFTFQPVQNNLLHQVYDDDILFDHSSSEKFRKSMNDLIAKYPFMNNSYYRNMGDFLFNPNKLFESHSFRCLLSSAYSIYIDPYGNIMPCLGLEVAGNIKDMNFLNIWKSEKNFQIQQRMRSKNNRCICWLYNNLYNQYLVEAYRWFYK